MQAKMLSLFIGEAMGIDRPDGAAVAVPQAAVNSC